MARKRYSESERKKFLEWIDKKNVFEIRKRRLYNRFYRKSFLFIGSTIARLLYFCLFIIVIIFYESSIGFRKEIVETSNKEVYKISTKRGTRTNVKLYLETAYSTYFYTNNIEDYSVPEIFRGDTIEVERNIFRKGIYFTRQGWKVKYAIDLNFQFYYIIFFVTFVSFFFYDGLDPFVTKLLWVTYAVDIIALSIFFFT